MSEQSSIPIFPPLASVIVSISVAEGDSVQAEQELFVVESMKMQTAVYAPFPGTVSSVSAKVGSLVQPSDIVLSLTSSGEAKNTDSAKATTTSASPLLKAMHDKQNQSLDENRTEATAKRHAKGYRTARENLADLCDEGSFNEYGQLAVAAQRSRRSAEDLDANTMGDGILTGTATINQDLFGKENSQAAVIVNDYSVLAGTQGFFHHAKLDRMLITAEQSSLPVVMFTEGGGGRPGDTDVHTQIAGLHYPSFLKWAELAGKVPRIAVNNGYCFAGNAALFGCADIRIATKQSWIGMAGPAMIEGGGLGIFKPTDIGPVETQAANGVLDIVAEDEADATRIAKQVLGYFQGNIENWEAADQTALREILPPDRRFTYKVRELIELLVDQNSFLELRQAFGRALVTGFARLEGKPIAIVANDCSVLGGAIDSQAADKAARFFELCERMSIPILSLCDTPGFMVGPDSEKEGAVHRMPEMFIRGAALTVPLVTVFVRKGYGLGAMAMGGGSFARPVYSVAWPSGEFGAMGLEGAVTLGFKKELEAQATSEAKQALFDKKLAELYEKGKATETAAYLEIDAVIDPADTRDVVCRAFASASPSTK